MKYRIYTSDNVVLCPYNYILLTNWLLLYELSLIRKCLKTVIFGSHFAIENIYLSVFIVHSIASPVPKGPCLLLL